MDGRQGPTGAGVLLLLLSWVQVSGADNVVRPICSAEAAECHVRLVVTAGWTLDSGGQPVEARPRGLFVGGCQQQYLNATGG